jgi:hypothetical protein
MRQKSFFSNVFLLVIISLLYASEVTAASQNDTCIPSREQHIQLGNDLTLVTVIDTKNATFYARLTYHGLAWLALGISPSGYMLESEVVIGLPDANTVSKYHLNSKSPSGIVLMNDSQQTLLNRSITQNGTHTVLEYLKKLDEPDELVIVPDVYNTLIWAVGTSNVLGYHAIRDSTTVKTRLLTSTRIQRAPKESQSSIVDISCGFCTVLAPQSHGVF